MKKINIYQIDAFTEKAFEGNPAGVTLSDGLTEKEMQKIANEMNLAETAFLSKSEKGDYNLRWFTPALEVTLCGHATIASLHFLNEQKLLKNSKINFETRSGVLKCGIEDGNYFMQIPIYNTKEFDGDIDEVLSALRLSKDGTDKNIPHLLMENGNLFIYVKTIDILKSIKPDFNTLKEITSRSKEFQGVAVFTRETVEKENFAHCRYFVPFFGINEDPVTGSVNGPLLTVLMRLGFVKDGNQEIKLTFEQGDFLNRRGRITVKYIPDADELYIMGKAVTVLKGEMSF